MIHGINKIIHINYIAVNVCYFLVHDIFLNNYITNLTKVIGYINNNIWNFHSLSVDGSQSLCRKFGSYNVYLYDTRISYTNFD